LQEQFNILYEYSIIKVQFSKYYNFQYLISLQLGQSFLSKNSNYRKFVIIYQKQSVIFSAKHSWKFYKYSFK